MDILIFFCVLILLINSVISGTQTGRHMTLFFDELKNEDPKLWRELARPNTSNIFDLAGYMRGNQILFKGNDQLANHPRLSVRYRLARKWFLRFQLGGLLIPIIIVMQLIENSL